MLAFFAVGWMGCELRTPRATGSTTQPRSKDQLAEIPDMVCSRVRETFYARQLRRTEFILRPVAQAWTVSPVTFVVKYRAEAGPTRLPAVEQALAYYVDKHVGTGFSEDTPPFWEEMNKELAKHVARASQGLRYLVSYVIVGGSSFVPTFRASAVFVQKSASCDIELCETFFFRVPRLQVASHPGTVFDVPITLEFNPGVTNYPDYLAVYDLVTEQLTKQLQEKGAERWSTELRSQVEDKVIAAHRHALARARIRLFTHRGGEERALRALQEPFDDRDKVPFLNFEQVLAPEQAVANTALPDAP